MVQICGCYYYIPSRNHAAANAKHYLPRVKNQSRTTIVSTASRTTLVQTFSNPSSSNIEECVYTFPLYEGVSVVSFTCHVGSRVLRGVVKEKSKAKESYDKAVAQGQTAGLLEQLPEASDVFSTKLGNIPAGETVHVDITYVGELKYDAEANGIRFTLPTVIAPRYGTQPRSASAPGSLGAQERGGIEIIVDVNMPEGTLIQGIQSPSHPIAVTLGKTSSSIDSASGMHRASATLSSKSTELDQDFVLILQIKDHNAPKALLEKHPGVPNQRALMVTLVPNFSLQPSRPEIVFIADRSGSMTSKIPTLISALRIFLKSLPVGVKFNICSFGSSHSFLWPRSKAYSHDSLEEATQHIEGFSANFGGTEIFNAVQATIVNRFADLPCEVILLTDGEVWDQSGLFQYLNKEVEASETGLRVFTLGIGASVSHALVEGIARAGNGFAQTVGEDEKFDKKVVRMLKGALSPHLKDCEMEVKYEASGDSDDDGFVLVEKVTDSLRVLGTHDATSPRREAEQKPISFYEQPQSSDRMDLETSPSAHNAGADPYAHLPAVPTPKLLQTPSRVPSLFPFSRTVIYILLSEKAAHQTPKSVILHATSPQGPLELAIPVEELSEPGETIHQLAARKTIQEFEEGRGWIFDSRDEAGVLLREKFPGSFEEIVEREAVRLGTQFQVSGKWLAFVAVAENDQQMPGQEQVMTRINSGSGLDDVRTSPGLVQFCSTAYSQPSGTSNSPPYAMQMVQSVMPPSAQLFSSASHHYPRQQQQQSAATSKGGLFGGLSPSGTRGGGSVSADSPSWRGNRGGSHTSRGGMSSATRGGSYSGGPLPPAPPQTGLNFGGPASPGPQRGPPLGGGLLATQFFNGHVPSAPPQTGPTFGAGSPPGPQRGVVSGSVVADGTAFSCTASIPAKRSNTFKAHRKQKTASQAIERQSSDSPSLGDEVLYSLISLQTFAGFWELNDEVVNIIGIPREMLGLLENRIIGEKLDAAEDNQNLWVTLLVVRFMEMYMQEEKDVWDLVVDKARAWLGERTLGEGVREEVDRVLKEVKG